MAKLDKMVGRKVRVIKGDHFTPEGFEFVVVSVAEAIKTGPNIQPQRVFYKKGGIVFTAVDATNVKLVK